MGETAKSFGAKGLAWLKITAEGQLDSVIAKFLDAKAFAHALPEAKPGDLVFFGADTPAVVHDVLGRIRLLLGEELKLIDTSAWRPLWVIDFPLLDYSHEEKRYIFMHNPFAAPLDEDLPLLDSEPLKVRAKAYDMVLNGSEIGGGSIRNHRSDVQLRILDLLGISKEQAQAKFGFLLDASRLWGPATWRHCLRPRSPHHAPGRRRSIRDVIAFPKTQTAQCPLTDAPSSRRRRSTQGVTHQARSRGVNCTMRLDDGQIEVLDSAMVEVLRHKTFLRNVCKSDLPCGIRPNVC